MKGFLALVLLAGAGWLGWYVFHEDPGFTDRFETITNRVFSPLDTSSPNATGELSRLYAEAKAAYEKNDLSREEAILVSTLCRRLNDANNQREQFENEYRRIHEREYKSFRGYKGEEYFRNHALAAQRRKWTDYVQESRAAVLTALAHLREYEAR